MAIAKNPNTPKDILNKLRQDDNSSVAGAAAEQSLPEEWRGLDNEARISKLQNENPTTEILAILSLSDDYLIRKAVVLSSNTSESVILQLKNDNYREVSSAINDRGLPNDWKYLTDFERINKITNGPIDENILQILSGSYSWEIRQLVAENTKTSIDIIKHLSKDEELNVKLAACNSLVKKGILSMNDIFGGEEPLLDDNEIQYFDKTELSVYGTGAMLCIYELDKDKYETLLSDYEEDELDYDDLELGIDGGDQIGVYWEPILLINGSPIELELEKRDYQINQEEEEVTTKGSYWSIKVENYKGTWGNIRIPEKFKWSKLSCTKQKILIGSGDETEVLQLAKVIYDDGRYGQFDDHSLEGKSIDWYLVDDEGDVTAL